jgi:transaldolase
VRGRAVIANARLAYQRYERMLSSTRWQALAAAGASAQRPLWASTSTKDPAYPGTRYVVDIVAPNVVNTMPEATLRAVADHGEVRGDTVHGQYPDAQRVLDQLEELGIGYADVVQKLENDGVATFEAAWDNLRERLASTLQDQHPTGASA